MRREMRKEVKIGLAFCALFSLINYPIRSIVGDVLIIEFLCGTAAALSILYTTLGLLPEDKVNHLRRWKRKSKE